MNQFNDLYEEIDGPEWQSYSERREAASPAITPKEKTIRGKIESMIGEYTIKKQQRESVIQDIKDKRTAIRHRRNRHERGTDEWENLEDDLKYNAREFAVEYTRRQIYLQIAKDLESILDATTND